MSQKSQHILQRVAEFIEKKGLLPPRDWKGKEGILRDDKGRVCTESETSNNPFVYIGLSGGGDSVALLHILHTLGYECKALHCNFHLRGAESDRDQQFCETLCASLGIPLEVRHFDTFAYMEEHHLSVEMAARELRYNWWSSLSNPRPSLIPLLRGKNPAATNYPPPMQGERGGLSLVALGHHQDDSIETMLMNLMRGTGIHGMTGIVARNEARHIIRPLLCLSRQDIVDYLS